MLNYLFNAVKSLADKRYSSADDLIKYCVQNELYSTGFISSISTYVQIQIKTIYGSENYNAFRMLFSYFFAKACWIGYCHEKLNRDAYYEPFGNVNINDISAYKVGSDAHYIVQHLNHFFHANPENMSTKTYRLLRSNLECVYPPANENEYQRMVRGYYGNFETKIPISEFRRKLQQAVVDTGANFEEHFGAHVTDEVLNSFIESCVNFRLEFPSSWYDDHDVGGINEALADLAILVELNEIIPFPRQRSSILTLFPLSLSFACNIEISQIVRDMVLHTYLPSGLRH